jgi:hypothetical protein
VAQQLRLLSLRYFDTEPGEYSSFRDATVEMVYPIPPERLRALFPPSGAEDEEGWESSPQLLILGVSSKSSFSWGACAQALITVRVIGQQRLEQKLAALNATSSTCVHDDRHGEEEPEAGSRDGAEPVEGTVLSLNRIISTLHRKDVAATKALVAVGQLLGLVRPASKSSDAEADIRDENGKWREMWLVNKGSAPATTEEMEVQLVVDFLAAVAGVATTEAEEGSFPVHTSLRKAWETRTDHPDDLPPVQAAS